MQGYNIVALAAAVLCVIAVAHANNKDVEQPNTEITSPPSSEVPIYLMVGEKLELTCEDSDGYDVEWTKNSTIIDSNSASQFVITTSKSTEKGRLVTYSDLAKESVTFEDSSTYECKAKGSSSSHRTNVVVFEITSEPVDFVSSKVSLVLKCDVKGLTSPYPMNWYRNGKKIESDQYHKMEDVNNTLTILEPADIHAGIYVCGFELTNSKKNYSHEVHVRAPPRVQKFDKSKNLVQGDPLVLDCIVHGWPAPTVQWIKDALPLDPDTRISFSTKNDVVNSSLRIENMDYPDRADYGCIANNTLGAHNSTITVRVKDKLAALWPFLGICAEVSILCVIIFIYEKRRAKKMEEEDAPEETGHLTNSHDHKNKDDVRQRK